MSESNLPPFDQVVAQHTMRMERIVVEDFPSEVVDTLIDVSYSDGTGWPHHPAVRLYKVQCERIQGYLPAKVWFDARDKQLHMSFYCTPSLPDAARPFGNDPMYVFTLDVNQFTTVSYDVEARVFIDQLNIPNDTCRYVFVFGQSQYDRLIDRSKT